MTAHAIGRAAATRMQSTAARRETVVAQNARTVSGVDILGEVSDLAAGLGMLALPLAPFALPAFALTALAAVALLILVVVGLVLAGPILLALHWWRSRDRRSSDANAVQAGAGAAGASGAGGVPCPAQLGHLPYGATGSAGEVG